MRFGILGTGVVGKTIAVRLDSLGHEVIVGTRDPEETISRTDPTNMAIPHSAPGRRSTRSTAGYVCRSGRPRRDGRQRYRRYRLAWRRSSMAGEDNLNGKILIDYRQPAGLLKGMPPTLLVSNTDSLGEQIQRRFPEAKVVKTLHTMNAYLMVDPAQLAATDHTVFVSGDDAEAKAR